jgi:hypothetical protein
MAYDLAVSQKVCVRPILRRVHDRQDGSEDVVARPCGPSCAYKARVLRMQQCTEGWHRDTEPDHDDLDEADEQHDIGSGDAYLSNDDDLEDRTDSDDDHDLGDHEERSRRVRSTRRRQDMPDLPRVPVEDRTVGQVFISRAGSTGRACL